MTKNKRLVSRMMLTLLVLTLVSFCCVGFTFARYTSSASGTATTTVAKWAVDFKDQAGDVMTYSTKLKLAKLSPSKDAYDATKTRTNSTGVIKVATITNNSDVAALVKITAGEISLKTITTTTSDYDADKAKLPFSIKFYSDAAGTTEITADFELAATDGTKDIYAVVTWTSDGLTGIEANGDVNDTMIGKNVESVSWTITYTATQNTQINS